MSRPRTPAMTVLIVGLVAAALPFGMSAVDSSYETANGVVVARHYRDWIAIGGGGVALACGFVAIVMLLRARSLGYLAGAAAIVVLGGFQLARGLGVFWTPDVSTSTAPSLAFPDPPPAPDPAQCADRSACAAIAASRLAENDLDGALVARGRGCAFGDAKACDDAGDTYFRAKQLDKALPLLAKGCELGNHDSCNTAGVMYLNGEGVAKDLEHGRALFAKACEARELLGCKNLAVVYHAGLGVPANDKQALAYARRACGDGHVDATSNSDIAFACDLAGVMLLDDKIVNRDLPAAVALFDQACTRDPSFCYNLGVVTAAGNGVAKDPKRARELYGKACDAGNADACNNLGDMANRGIGGAKDVARAKQLFDKACTAGSELGCKNKQRVK
ncbi:MAG TPA: tetratricopeptide repeat protein [Kofleriaceae bacterium]|nr:tetratricopeptide repeat protein [Kofleriaceae bacterium]